MFYTYLWLREDGTPYYVGYGQKQRAFKKQNHNVPLPPSLDRVLVEYHDSIQDAKFAEQFLISYFGRKDIGTGCLRNLTEGGEGTTGKKFTPEQIQRLSEAHLGQAGFWTNKKLSDNHKDKLSSSHRRFVSPAGMRWCSGSKHFVNIKNFHATKSGYCKECISEYARLRHLRRKNAEGEKARHITSDSLLLAQTSGHTSDSRHLSAGCCS